MPSFKHVLLLNATVVKPKQTLLYSGATVVIELQDTIASQPLRNFKPLTALK
jgi:hypothetical protein